MIKKIEDFSVELDTIIDLYNSIDWRHYTENKEAFKKALENSSYVYGIYEENTLIGLIRGLTDTVSIHYIQDIIVSKKHQNKGLGTQLVEYVLEKYSNVRAHILLTDDEPGQLAFYKKLNFHNTKELVNIPLNSFVMFKGFDLS